MKITATEQVGTCERAGCSTTFERKAKGGQRRYCSVRCRTNARAAAWRANNLERSNELARESRQRVKARDPLRVKAEDADRGAVKRIRATGRTATTLGAVVIVGLWEAQGGCCLTCRVPLDLAAAQGTDGAPEVAHLVPIATGGEHVPDNLAWLCSPCNGAQRHAVGLDAVRRIGLAALDRGRGVAVLHASVIAGAEGV